MNVIQRAGSVSARCAARTSVLLAPVLVAAICAPASAEELTLENIPFNGTRAHQYLEQICAIGPRVTGTEGMKRQQELLVKHFEELGAKVKLQPWREKQGGVGKKTDMANLIVEWHPESTERILLCAHYDTRPFPDRDPVNPQGVFLGANDGGSGVAILMELGNEMSKLQCKYGVDFVFLDAEEFVYHDREKYFMGANTFARRYRTQKPPFKYRWGVLLDMVGDADLRIPQERYSLSWKEVRPLIGEIWSTASRLGVKEFVSEVGYEIRDDHLELYNVGKIPTVDLIDFDYGPNHGYWHTTQDVPKNCSALSMAKVGWVLSEWLKTAK